MLNWHTIHTSRGRAEFDSEVFDAMSQQKAIVILVLLLFYAINVTRLNSRPATVDDLDTIKHLYSNTYDKSYNFTQTIESVSELSPEHGPAYYIILNAWRKIVGEDLFLARLFSVFLSLAAICTVYRLALLTGKSQTAVAAPIILAFLAYVNYYAQIARVYPLLLLVGGWLLWCYWGAVARKRVYRQQWLGLFVSAASLLYVHYFGALLLAAIAIHHVLFAPKNTRWFAVASVLAAGSALFALWIPVVIRGYGQSHNALADSALSFSDGLLVTLGIYSNGIWFLPLLAAAILVVNRRRLNRAEIYLIVATAVVIASLLLLNEIMPILTERRMRYSLILAAPFCCTLAIAWSRLPAARPLRSAVLVLWIGAFAQFAASPDLAVYTNQRSREQLSIPHYQDFIYESHRLPGHNEPILSVHPGAPVSRVAFLRYYRLRLSDWAHVAHVSLDENGEPVLESGLSIYASLEAISQNSRGIWISHNPKESDLNDMGGIADWLTQDFQFCRRYLEQPEHSVDFYLKRGIPCSLVTAEEPLAVSYNNGTALANLVYERDADSLVIYLRWLRTIDKAYAFSLQLFDDEDHKLLQVDKVISSDPVDVMAFDLAGIPAGNYVGKLIVYDRESKLSQPGVTARDQLPFERTVDVLDFEILE